MSPKTLRVPKAAIQRLAMYVEILEEMLREDVRVISSEALANACALNSSQIRKDLAYFGEFGVRGVGYYVSDLLQALKKALGLDRSWKAALIGVGNLGRALLRHHGLKQRGFLIVAAFDCDPYKIGEDFSGLTIWPPKEIKTKVKELGFEIGIITTPPDRAQRAANFLVKAGLKAILNYAPTRIQVPEDVAVEYADFFHHLYALAFHVSNAERQSI